MSNPTLPLTDLLPVLSDVAARPKDGMLSSDPGILVLMEIEQRLRAADHLASCTDDRLSASLACSRRPLDRDLRVSARARELPDRQRRAPDHPTPTRLA